MVLDRLRSIRHLLSAPGIFLKHRPDSVYTVADRLEEHADDHPDRPFVLYEDQVLSWGEVDAAANRVAHWAEAQRLKQGDVVALLMENRPDYLVLWLGLAKRGIVSALINTNLGGAALDHALRTSQAAHLVVGTELLDSVAGASAEVTQNLRIWAHLDPEGPDTKLPEGCLDLAAALEDASDERPPWSVRETLRAGDDLFYIYTSGTTGNPKAARISHARFFLAGDGFAWAAEAGPDDVDYVVLPLYHSAGGVAAVGRVLEGGGTIALRRKFSASRFWDDVRRYRATCFQYIGEFCRYLMAQPARPDDREHPIRVIVGNGLRPDVWTAFQERFGIPKIIEFYGATEGNTVMVNLGWKAGAVGWFPPMLEFANTGRIVRFDVETELHPRNEEGFCIECGTDEPGELLGRIGTGRSMAGRFEGYTSPEATERKILRDVFKKGDAWFRSGDLLSRDEEGYYYFVDRIGDTFRWKGENVSTQEVAELLAGCPGLDLINVYGVEVAGADGRAGMLAYVPQEGAAFDGPGLFAWAAERLPAYATPVFVRPLGRPELTGTFKLRKVDLQREGFDLERIDDPVYVRDDRAKDYVRLDAEILEAIRQGRWRL
ncbi:MAG: long-chain-acyl-CoA synthetase [Deltaproteobacteria bacterium]|nr:long-chain-acyl-CoA synthetase [Deltaproteobacteria bacterium]